MSRRPAVRRRRVRGQDDDAVRLSHRACGARGAPVGDRFARRQRHVHRLRERVRRRIDGVLLGGDGRSRARVGRGPDRAADGGRRVAPASREPPAGTGVQQPQYPRRYVGGPGRARRPDTQTAGRVPPVRIRFVWPLRGCCTMNAPPSNTPFWSPASAGPSEMRSTVPWVVSMRDPTGTTI